MRRMAMRCLARWRWAVCTAGGMMLAGCASAAPDGNPDAEAGAEPRADSTAVTLQSVRGDIERAIGDVRAESLSACRLIGLGARPCGGPRVYVAYSITQTDSAGLAALVEIYNRLDRERNEREGLVSTCEVVGRPTITWEAGRCGVGR